MRIDPDTCRDADLLAAEVRRLRNVLGTDDARLTDAEREAVETCIADDEAMTHHSRAATLRGLLERLGGGETELAVTEPMPKEQRAEVSVVLTDAECDDLRVWLAECLRQASAATEGGNEELAERWLERSRRAAALLERLG